MFEIIDVTGGYVIRWVEANHICYQGRDGYLARFLWNAVPFKTLAEAESCVK